ncbi:MAG TPA: polar amino acid ABC transporter permease, partial [Ruminococcaceae bacterium]|nr:polar amino acid ABC transporter permease [Oscillospiraceae bacterium]
MNYSILLSQMLEASLMSLRLFFSTLLFSVPLGLLVAAGRRSRVKLVSWPVR